MKTNGARAPSTGRAHLGARRARARWGVALRTASEGALGGGVARGERGRGGPLRACPLSAGRTPRALLAHSSRTCHALATAVPLPCQCRHLRHRRATAIVVWVRRKAVQGLGLLSAKPVIYGANVADSDLAEGNAMVESVRQIAATEGASVVIVSAQVEAELVDLEDEERTTFLEELGVEKVSGPHDRVGAPESSGPDWEPEMEPEMAPEMESEMAPEMEPEMAPEMEPEMAPELRARIRARVPV